MIKKEEIIKWIQRKEDQTIEFKEFAKLDSNKKSARKDLAKLFAAFANTKGGIVLFGVKDNGELEGKKLTRKEFEKYHQKIVNIATDLCRPSLIINIDLLENLEMEGIKGDVLIVVVPPSPLTMVDGKIYVRIGTHIKKVEDPSLIDKIKKGELSESEKHELSLEEYLEELEIPKKHLYYNDYEVPYFVTRYDYKYSLTCCVFLYVPSIPDPYYTTLRSLYRVSLENLEKIIENYYKIFGTYGNSGFAIEQFCRETYKNFAWIGYGYKNFIEALKNQKKRYKETNIISPHHREGFCFVDVLDNFVFYICGQPNAWREQITIGHLVVGFIFSGIPLGDRRILKFLDECSKDLKREIILDGLHQIDEDYTKFRRIKDLKIEKIHGIITEEGITEEEEIAGLLISNPYPNREVPYDKIIMQLREYPPKEEEKFILDRIEIMELPYYGFGCKIVEYSGTYL